MGNIGICSNCKFWKKDEIRKTYGECHRFAPRAEFIMPNGTTRAPRSAMWAYTESTEWCGEWVIIKD